jgi:hypothetical protein
MATVMAPEGSGLGERDVMVGPAGITVTVVFPDAVPSAETALMRSEVGEGTTAGAV